MKSTSKAKKCLCILLIISMVLFSVVRTSGQVIHPEQDGVYEQRNNADKSVIPYTHLREADVMWSKRVWRTIDLREKLNHPLYYPTEAQANYKSLFDVIVDGINEGTINAYDPIDDRFTTPMSLEETMAKLVRIDTIWIDHWETGEPMQQVIENETTTGDIRQYHIKEDWVFDKQRSVMEARIVGICPISIKRDEMGNEIGREALFWIYFPQARYVFANQPVYNRHNDVRFTYEDLFHKRMFASYIHKVSNVYNRAVYEYARGIEYQLEAEKLKNDIFVLEHDLWHY